MIIEVTLHFYRTTCFFSRSAFQKKPLSLSFSSLFLFFGPKLYLSGSLSSVALFPVAAKRKAARYLLTFKQQTQLAGNEWLVATKHRGKEDCLTASVTLNHLLITESITGELQLINQQCNVVRLLLRTHGRRLKSSFLSRKYFRHSILFFQ